MSEELEKKDFSRRSFIGGAALAGVALAACAAPPREEALVALGPKMTLGPELAPDGEPIRAGIIGCGGRGTGAAGNFLSSGPNLQVVALADTFEDRLERCRGRLKEQNGAEIADDQCFVGLDAYKRVLEADINYVIIATPPYFHPDQFEAAVEARKHVFMEKPAGVDPAGARSIMETAEKATALNLKVATGTQRRHQKNYIETYNRIMDGSIGQITSARAYWNQSQLWFRERQNGWSDMEWMLRDWVNWCWLSGDHIVEQHVHNVDVINWFTHSHPVNAVGMGGRARRVTGDQYDFFAVDYEMENGIHMMSMCRQVDGSENNVSEYIVGTKGSSNCADTIYDLDGNITWQYEPAKDEAGNVTDTSPYVQEHIDLITCIREDKPINEATDTAVSTLTAVMGRTSSYTGKLVTWDEMMASDTKIGPDELKLGSYPDIIKAIAPPVPGTAAE
ncbi:MAG: Gfo/Idh/MocA family oxidoreductase [Acidobacteriota bacterium]